MCARCMFTLYAGTLKVHICLVLIPNKRKMLKIKICCTCVYTYALVVVKREQVISAAGDTGAVGLMWELKSTLKYSV